LQQVDSKNLFAMSFHGIPIQNTMCMARIQDTGYHLPKPIKLLVAVQNEHKEV